MYFYNLIQISTQEGNVVLTPVSVSQTHESKSSPYWASGWPAYGLALVDIVAAAVSLIQPVPHLKRRSSTQDREYYDSTNKSSLSDVNKEPVSERI